MVLVALLLLSARSVFAALAPSKGTGPVGHAKNGSCELVKPISQA